MAAAITGMARNRIFIDLSRSNTLPFDTFLGLIPWLAVQLAGTFLGARARYAGPMLSAYAPSQYHGLKSFQVNLPESAAVVSETNRPT